MLFSLRPAVVADLDALCHLEATCFDGDRFTRRQLGYLLARANAHTLVAVSTENERAVGYATLLFRRNSQTARLYSFCVSQEARGGGVGRALLEALEREASRRGLTRMQLEVRADNRVALGLYRRMGFSPLRWLEEYYVDGCAAWQMDKALPATERDATTPDTPAEGQSQDGDCREHARIAPDLSPARK
ncbi:MULTISPECIES: GNAT family N-acetyltransferase [Chromohalobacter]|uniref:GNAT family N-acetyltransferase n=1 Tax=Chromohalobacter TaxID=42054 RepID=UPI0015C4E458|nr:MULTISPECIES: GNAT family N-acetyltransferase [Chromohalobacter]NQY46606.1 GNAT family N-acetyltransferase [Chromohalobacter sp.]NWO57563.1 GNAT family N-acetyltransferase [Chromohalobacter salexigens]